MLNPWVVVAGIFAFCVLVAEVLGEDAVLRRRSALVAGVTSFALAFVMRHEITAPTFVHANFHGASLVDSVLAFPDAPTHRDEYGPVGFTVLGAIAWLFEGAFTTVRLANCAFSSLAICFMALYVRRVTERDAAGIATLLVGIASMPLMRLANSEDVHNVGLFLFCVGLYAADVAVTTRSFASLAVATLSFVGMVYARQTFFMLVPVCLIAAFGRGGFALLRAPTLVVAALIVVTPTLVRIVASFATPDDATTYRYLGEIVRIPGVVPMLLGAHPLLDVPRFGAVPTILLVIGAAVAARESNLTRALLAAFLAMFVLTLPFGHPTPGVELAFRLPAILCSLPIAGIGGGFVFDTVASGLPDVRARALIATVASLLVLLSPATGRYASILRRSSPDLLEYTFVEEHLGVLPRNATVVVLRPTGRMPSYAASRRTLARRADLRVVEFEAFDRRQIGYFLFGVQCFGYSLEEYLDTGAARGAFTNSPDAARLTRAVYAGRWSEAGLEAPRGMRAACRSLFDGSAPVGPTRTIRAPLDDAPYVVYSGEPFDVGFRRLAPRPR